MSVVLRCPNCGTTQATSGECEACHEAQVRYFCTNHEPGIWLTGPTCPQCAARVAPRPPAPIPRPRPPARVVIAPSREERPPRGWFLQLIGRLAMISLVFFVALALAIYWVVRSL